MRGRSCPAASPSARPRVPLDSGERAQGGGLDQECSRDSPDKVHLESQIERDRDKQKPRRADAKSRWLRRRTLSRRERHRRLRYASSACTAAARRARLLPIAFLGSHPSCGRANWQSSFLWTGPLSFRWRRATRQTYVLGIAERMTELELRTIPLCSLQWTHIGLPVNTWLARTFFGRILDFGIQGAPPGFALCPVGGAQSVPTTPVLWIG